MVCRVSMPTLPKKIRQNVPCFRQSGLGKMGFGKMGFGKKGIYHKNDCIELIEFIKNSGRL